MERTNSILQKVNGGKNSEINFIISLDFTRNLLIIQTRFNLAYTRIDADIQHYDENVVTRVTTVTRVNCYWCDVFYLILKCNMYHVFNVSCSMSPHGICSKIVCTKCKITNSQKHTSPFNEGDWKINSHYLVLKLTCSLNNFFVI